MNQQCASNPEFEENQFILDVLHKHAERNPDQSAFVVHHASGLRRDITWAEHLRCILQIQQQICQLVDVRNQRVGIVAPDPYTALVLEHALCGTGASVEIVDLQLLAQIETVAPILLLPDAFRTQLPDELKRWRGVAVMYDGSVALQRARSPESRNAISAPELFEAGIATFTSGSTGTPRRLSFSLAQVSLAAEALLQRFPPMAHARTSLCWLPLTALYQRVLSCCALIAGTTQVIIDSPRQLYDELPRVSPDYLFGIPLCFEELRRRGIRLQHDGCPKDQIAATLFGPRIQFLVTGSAKASASLFDYFDDLGVPLLEAYGTSECIIPIAANSPQDRKPLSVGKPFPQHAVWIDSDGHVALRSQGMALEYWESMDPPQLTTQDLGSIDAQGYLTLTGRAGDMFKMSNGRKLSSSSLESPFQELPFVVHAVILAQDCTALFGLLFVNPASSLSDRDIALACEEVNATRPAHEQVLYWGMLRRFPEETSGELTRTGKIRRQSLRERYAPELRQRITELAQVHSSKNCNLERSWVWHMSY